MSRSGAEIRASEMQSKLIQDRITATEKHLGQLCDTLSSYTRKSAHVRDKGDQMAKDLVNYAEYETMSLTLKKGFTHFAENLSTIQDYREAQVSRLESKVVAPLSNYGLMCKQTKNELKAAFSARDKEQQQRRKLDKVKQKNPGDRRQITQAETNLQKASVDASRSSKALEQQMDTFETKKVQDLKKMLSEFVNIEMMFHAKALEMYTKCFQTLAIIDPEEDLEEFRKQTRPSSGSSTSRYSLARSASDASLNSSRAPPSVDVTPTSQRRLPNSAKSSPAHNNTRQTTPTSQQGPRTVTQVVRKPNSVDEYEDDDDDEDDEDDDEDDDDSYEDETTEADTARTSGSKRR
ncbi:CBY1-interacting BAR domain-containing protein 1-like [Haliotis cracherodii]|uniref:CBY1-interacting BAR domain-containing protein 1-like n=1 Tax=Haliotis rufescens TaxID=6454 RepID=UPI00201EFE01|nr:CBY1-interacting BAR domain-containing protein 1-like [Haliotis rufescens]